MRTFDMLAAGALGLAAIGILESLKPPPAPGTTEETKKLTDSQIQQNKNDQIRQFIFNAPPNPFEGAQGPRTFSGPGGNAINFSGGFGPFSGSSGQGSIVSNTENIGQIRGPSRRVAE